MHASEIWNSSSVKAKLIRTSLIPASLGYGLGWELYLACYKLGLKKPKSPHHPVICVGNLQAGGSGKTPVTRFLARYLQESKYQVVVSCSGYGSDHSVDANAAPQGELLASIWGDEPAMFRWLEPDIPLVVGRNRVRAAEIVHELYPQSVLILDDGFQHLPLGKDLTIVLDPKSPINTFCLPAGPYREPRSNRKRADLLVPGALKVVPSPTKLKNSIGEERKPERYSVLCALGNPQRFLQDLERFVPSQGGFDHVALLPDHDRLGEADLFKSFSKDLPVVVTAKDWVKLRERTDLDFSRFLIASQEVRLEPIEIIERWLRNRTDR